MTPKQLTLTVHPDPLPNMRDPLYKAYAFTPKDKPADIARHVLADYTEVRGRPREIHCHPEYLDIVEKEAGGVPVIASGRARYVLLLGPLEV